MLALHNIQKTTPSSIKEGEGKLKKKKTQKYRDLGCYTKTMNVAMLESTIPLIHVWWTSDQAMLQSLNLLQPTATINFIT